MSWSVAVLISLGCFLAGFHSGWVRAHITVADERERLGGFYVGKTVFKCTSIELKKTGSNPLPSTNKRPAPPPNPPTEKQGWL